MDAALEDDIFKCIFLNEKFWIQFDWNLFPRVQLTITQHWLKWLGADEVTSHDLNQWWPRLVMHLCFNRPQWVNTLPPPGRSGCDLKNAIFKLILLIDIFRSFYANHLFDECHRFLLLISHHWFRWWFGAWWQQAIAWANVDWVPCNHMASL